MGRGCRWLTAPSGARVVWRRESWWQQGGRGCCQKRGAATAFVQHSGSPEMTVPLPLQVNLVLNEGKSLGLMIRGGAEYSLGIYITGVDKGSEAESTGLKVRVTPEWAGAGDKASRAVAAGPCRHVTGAVPTPLPRCKQRSPWRGERCVSGDGFSGQILWNF